MNIYTSIDGTTNFVHGFPFVAISLGLIYKKSPVLGVIYNPFLDQLYTGVKGAGAYLTRAGRAPVKLPLAPPRPLASLSQALIGEPRRVCDYASLIRSFFLGVEWGSDRSSNAVRAKGDSYKRLAGNPKEGVEGGRMAHSLRSLGSAALNYAMVAQGGLDIYWCGYNPCCH